MMYRAVVALLDKKLDWIFAVLVLVTLGLGSWYVVLLVEDRDSTIVALKEQIGTAVEVPTTVNPGRPQPPSPQTSPTSQGATPAESALPQFDLSDVDSYSNGTVKLVVGRGLELDSSSWDESDSLYGEYSDIWFRDAGIFGQRGIQFALLSAGSNRSFATCRDQTSWVAFLDWDQVERGSFACVKHPSGRRGILRINQRPDLDSRVPTVEVSGELWAPVVDR